MLQAEQVFQGRYQLHRQLGHNAGRQTWLADDIVSHQPVIVKLLAFSPQMQWEELKLFEREAQVLKQLSHPKIPRYRDYFSVDKQAGSGLCWFGLVHDYIAGESLQQLLDTGKHFTEVQVSSIATGILEILTYLHELNPPVLHRDIKPSNLILGEDEQVYLVDFGAVQDPVAVEGATFTVVGTAGYAPVEQFWGRAVPASDLYALGATLIHLLTGTPPVDLPQKNLRIEFRDRVSVNRNFVRWIEDLTEPDLKRRFSSARQALEYLKAGCKSRQMPTIPKPAGSRVQLSNSASHLRIVIPPQRILIGGVFRIFWRVMLLACLLLWQFFINLLIVSIAIGVLLLGIPALFRTILAFFVSVTSLNIYFFIAEIIWFFLVIGFFVGLCQLWISINRELGRVRDKLNQLLLHEFE
ncbi:serine/threonine protein kinase [Kamptonema formosum]|uniref:serine/threonine protein kinase n=1 Tax=Kamptonema formosum TaxID=331992 RepID=UPI0003480E15|nr:serine/threonine-protein kinase [Oscillatoria sp. PCC 10802]